MLLGLALLRKRWLPRGERRMAALTGLLMMGGYSIFYLLALERGIAPGVLATILGVQPIFTLAIVERRWQPVRIGAALSLAGLALVVFRGIGDGGLSLAGIACAHRARRADRRLVAAKAYVRRPPTCCRCRMRSASRCAWRSCRSAGVVRPELGLVIPLLWLGIVISVIAQLLFYRLMQRGDLVNVTSLFYLVPVVTTLMDAAWLGNRLALAGMGAIIAAALVFRAPPAQPRIAGRRHASDTYDESAKIERREKDTRKAFV